MTAQLAKNSDKQRTSILFIDDEPRVLKSMRAMFRKDYDVHLANSGAEALEIVASENIQVVVSDQRMPEMTGVEVLTEIRHRAPHIVRILLTGYADLAAVEASINEAEVFKYLMKPCPADEVRGAVAQGLDARQMPHLAEVVPLPARAQKTHQASATAPVPEMPEPALDEAVDPAPVLAPVHAPAQARGTPRSSAQANEEVLVLSDDAAVVDAIATAVKGKTHKASSVESARTLLEARGIGVLVADVHADERSVVDLVDALREVQPGLVTVLVSERSDATQLIDLINGRQIFRFLLKPLQAGQCRISMTSAVNRWAQTDEIGAPGALVAPGRWQRFKNWMLGV